MVGFFFGDASGITWYAKSESLFRSDERFWCWIDAWASVAGINHPVIAPLLAATTVAVVAADDEKIDLRFIIGSSNDKQSFSFGSTNRSTVKASINSTIVIFIVYLWYCVDRFDSSSHCRSHKCSSIINRLLVFLEVLCDVEFSDFLLPGCLPGLDDITSSHVVDRGKYSYYASYYYIIISLHYYR